MWCKAAGKDPYGRETSIGDGWGKGRNILGLPRNKTIRGRDLKKGKSLNLTDRDCTGRGVKSKEEGICNDYRIYVIPKAEGMELYGMRVNADGSEGLWKRTETQGHS